MIRRSTAIWKRSGKEGKGTLSSTSRVLDRTPFSFTSRFTGEDGKAGTNPEELIAAAHAGCFSMALGILLHNAGFKPLELKTEAQLKMENVEGHFRIVSVHLLLTGKVPNINYKKFLELASKAKKTCPVSQALSSIEITLSAALTE